MKPTKKIKKILTMSLLFLAVFYLLMWCNSTLSVGTMFKKTTIKIDVKNLICRVNFNDSRWYIDHNSDMQMIYFVTPTFPRPEQIPELTRLAHTLMHVPRLHWIVADDQPVCSPLVLNILKRSGLPFTHISSPKPYIYKTALFPRGVANRRAALSWLHENIRDGVLYFGDDDNTLDLQIFNEIRQTKKVSMFPVGLIGNFGVSAPVVRHGKVVGFFDSWPARRTFPVDMAGFAVNLKFLKPDAIMPYIAGYEEDKFLRSLDLQLEDIEPLADNCSKVLVWHTRTTKNRKLTLKVDLHEIESFKNFDNFAKLLKELHKLGIANFDATNGTKLFITRTKHENMPKLVSTNLEKTLDQKAHERSRRSTLTEEVNAVTMSSATKLDERMYHRIRTLIDYYDSF